MDKKTIEKDYLIISQIITHLDLFNKENDLCTYLDIEPQLAIMNGLIEQITNSFLKKYMFTYVAKITQEYITSFENYLQSF